MLHSRMANLRICLIVLAVGTAFCAQAAEPASASVAADLAVCANPEYPKEALRLEQAGTVMVGLQIDVDGSVVDTAVRKSSGFPLLDEAARTTLARCKFKPAMVNGIPARVWTQVQYVWALGQPSLVPHQVRQEVDAYREKALAGEPDALFSLAQAYSRGKASEVSDVTSMLQALAKGPAAAQYELGHRLFTGVGATPDHNEAVVWFRTSADAGYAPAQLWMGWAYDTGAANLVRNAELAIFWYQKAAAQENHAAENSLGVMHHNARGVERDYVRAAAWYRKAAAGGETWGEANLGRLYLHGNGVDKDAAEALRLLNLAAAKDNHAAQGDLALMYFNGLGVPADDAQAIKYLRLAAEGGDQPSQLRLSLALSYGLRMPQDQAEAVSWMRKMAERGNPTGQNNLGYAYEIGHGVPQDYLTARDWYAQAIAKGNGEAEAALGGMYEQGQGVEKNLAKAIELYQSAIGHGNAHGMVSMAALYEAGLGVEKNPATARALYERAAQLNNEAAMRRLATALRNGELGLTTEPTTAQEWLRKADDMAAHPFTPFKL